MRSVAALIVLLMTTGVVASGQPAVGEAAPDFKLQDQKGEWHTLSDYRGKWLAVYFYPRDDTPGCTTEACNFRDNIYVFRAIGAEVVGISLDDVDSHRRFSEKYQLPFVLLADPEGGVVSAYGVEGEYRGQTIARRESFLINPDGQIAKHYSRVDPDSHTDEVISDLKALMTP